MVHRRDGKLQRLRSKLGYVKHGVSSRVASTFSTIRDAYVGFPTVHPMAQGAQDESSDPAELCRARYLQLRNTIVRALLVDEVNYEPSSLLKKSRRAVVLITGADLVLVKMTPTTKAGSAVGSNSRSSSSSNTPAGADQAASTAAAAAAGAAAGAAGAGSSQGVSRGSFGRSLDAAGGLDASAVLDDAHASVLAQHELNKLVKCEVSGDRLELEFIVTGGAQFKVSAAALGLNAASTLPSSSMARLQEEDAAEASTPGDAAAGAAEAAAAVEDAGLGRRSGSGDQQQQQAAAAAVAQGRSGQQERMSPRSSGSSPVLLQGGLTDAPPTAATPAAAAAAAAPPDGQSGEGLADALGSGRQQATPAASAGIGVGSSSGLDSCDLVGPLDDPTAASVLLEEEGVERTLGSRTLARWINRYSSGSGGSGSYGVGSPPVANGMMSLSAVAGAPGRSFVRVLGSRSGAAEDGSRSSFRPVKTDDGEYLVWVEAFSLTFSNPSLAEMAAELLRSGRSTMRQALDWLKQGLPFSPEFAVTHITQLSSRGGDEVLRAGPTPWGTVLQLPDSWVEAVAAADLPEEQPLSTALEVPEGPAAFKIHLATPAGLAEATLLPELVAVLSQQPCTHGQVLAVPVDLTIQLTDATPSQQQQQQFATRVGSSNAREQPGDGRSSRQLGTPSSPQQQQQQDAGGTPGHPAAAAGRSASPITDKARSSSSNSRLTWADQQQQQGVDSLASSTGLRRRSVGAQVGPAAAGAQRSASLSTVSASAAAAAAASAGAAAGAVNKRPLTLQHSRSSPHLGQPERLLPEAAAEQLPSCDAADLAADQAQHAQQQQQGLGLRRRTDSSSSLPELGTCQQTAGVGDEAGLGSDPGTATAAAGSGAAGSSSADEPRLLGSSFGGSSRQQGSTQLLSFAGQHTAEVHAVLHVRLLLDTEDGSSTALPQLVLPPAAGAQVSPFAVAGAVQGLDDSGMPVSDGGLQMQHTIPQAPSILLLGPPAPRGPSPEQQQLLQTAVALLAALLCGLALLLRSSDAAAVLALGAVFANTACMALALHPWWFSRVGRSLQRVLRLPARHGSSHGLSHHHSSHHHHHHGSSSHPHHRVHHHHHHALKHHHSRGVAATAAGHGPQHSSGAGSGGGGVAAQRKLHGLRLQLLGGSFVKEALGLLEQQINAYRELQELQDTCSASYMSESDSDELESLSSEEEEHEMFSAVFVSSPEPTWLTRDWRRRLWHARPNMEERSKLAGSIHAWRESVRADLLLHMLPAKYDWFQKHLILRPLIKTEHHMVVLLKLSTLSMMPRLLPTASLTPTDLMRYCAFVWCWLFEEYVRDDWPRGRFVLLADMSSLKLGQAVGEGQIGGRALGEVCNAYPERLLRCLVLGAPNWFNMLYRLIRPQLSPSTRAKVQVCTTPAETVAELSCCLGADWVPAEFGGPCTRPYDDYPAQQALLAHVATLRQQPAARHSV